MLRSATDVSRLYLTADLRAIDAVPKAVAQGNLLHSELKRFPPVDDVVAVLDRIASQAFAA